MAGTLSLVGRVTDREGQIRMERKVLMYQWFSKHLFSILPFSYWICFRFIINVSGISLLVHWLIIHNWANGIRNPWWMPFTGKNVGQKNLFLRICIQYCSSSIHRLNYWIPRYQQRLLIERVMSTQNLLLIQFFFETICLLQNHGKICDQKFIWHILH